MTKQKSIFSRIVRKVKQDSGSAWNRRWINVLLAANDVADPIPDEARALQGDGFFRTVQLEAKMSDFDEIARAVDDEEAIVYPGLMAAWEEIPVTVEPDAAAARFALDNREELLATPLDRVRSLFPACLLFDIRAFALSSYGHAYEGLFVYPSYNQDRGYPVLLTLAVNTKEGLDFPLDSKIVLRGESFAEALDISKTEREITRRRCLGGFESSHLSLVYSPIEDDPSVCETAALALALMCSDRTVVETLPGSRERRLRVRLATEDEVAAAPAETSASDTEITDDASGTSSDAANATSNALEHIDELEPSPGCEGSVLSESEPGSPIEDGGDSPSEEFAADSSEPDQNDAIAVHDEAGVDNAADADQDDALSPAAQGNRADDADVAELHAKVASLEAALAEYEQKTSSLDFHLRQAQAAAAQAKARAAALQQRAEVVEHMDLPSTPLEALQLAERAFADRLSFTDSARRSAAEFDKGSPREVWAVLRSMATVLHPLVFGKAEGNVVYAFEAQTGFELTLREVKHTKRNDALNRLRTVDYKGRQRSIAAHVKGRGSKKGESLRVHFFVDADEGRIVIAHCGEHLRTYDTSSL